MPTMNDLPDELRLEIASHSQQRSLASLARVNKRWNYIATDLIYRNPCVDENSSYGCDTVFVLARELLRRRHMAKEVRHLSITAGCSHDHRSKAGLTENDFKNARVLVMELDSDDATAWLDDIVMKTAESWIGVVLALVPNLTTLEIFKCRHIAEWYLYSNFFSHTRGIDHEHGNMIEKWGFTSLKELTLPTISIDWQWYVLPNLQFLELDFFDRLPIGCYTTDPTVGKRKDWVSNVKRLHILCSTELLQSFELNEPDSLCTMFNHFPKLKHLEISMSNIKYIPTGDTVCTFEEIATSGNANKMKQYQPVPICNQSTPENFDVLVMNLEQIAPRLETLDIQFIARKLMTWYDANMTEVTYDKDTYPSEEDKDYIDSIWPPENLGDFERLKKLSVPWSAIFQISPFYDSYWDLPVHQLPVSLEELYIYGFHPSKFDWIEDLVTLKEISHSRLRRITFDPQGGDCGDLVEFQKPGMPHWKIHRDMGLAITCACHPLL